MKSFREIQGARQVKKGEGNAVAGVLKKPAIVLFYMVFAVIGLVAFTARPVTDWTKENFGVTIQEILFTVKSPMKGADTGFLKGALLEAKPDAVLFLVLLAGGVICDRLIFGRLRICIKIRLKKWHDINVRPVCYCMALGAALLSLHGAYNYLDEILKISDYLEKRAERTEIYENYYTDPLETEITSSGSIKNLIYIYLESMETACASAAAGGYQETDYIPGLTAIANENISFSDGSGLGGWRAVDGSTWTMGALFSTTAGIPFAFPIKGNTMGERSVFAPGVTNLGDLLEECGYTQEFLCGSDGNFAGRADYFQQHGNYRIFDYSTAIEEGYIAPDYKVWWGFEDSILYDIAKDELTRLAADHAPFNFTMLTVDTHHVGGYVCDLCGNVYQDQLANVLVCADSLLRDFVEWCKGQDFYEDTVIVISGDHPRMDTCLVPEEAERESRTVYNAFINADVDDAEMLRTRNRDFAPMDMFPTVLSAMGFRIEGDRLGLGTNLFSARDTLMEEMGGFENLNSELKKHSVYYVNHFY